MEMERRQPRRAQGAPSMTRRWFCALVCAALLFAFASDGARAQADQGFQDFLQSLWPRAEAAGVRRATFEAACAGLTPDPTAPSASAKQAEFDKPLKAYLAEAVSNARVQRGRAALARWRGELASISNALASHPRSSSRRGAWRPISARRRAAKTSSARSRHWLICVRTGSFFATNSSPLW